VWLGQRLHVKSGEKSREMGRGRAKTPEQKCLQHIPFLGSWDVLEPLENSSSPYIKTK
jgi:hypothetical protein